MFIPLLLLGISYYLASSGLGLDKAYDGLTLVMGISNGLLTTRKWFFVYRPLYVVYRYL
jgi:hypothetical protein